VGFLDSLKNLFGGKKTPRVNVESMSKVWRARDRDLGRTVCLKILDKEKIAKFDARFPGLKRPTEGFICQSLRHKNVVQTFEHGMTTKGEQYIVMELIEGVGLNFLIETKSAQLQGKRIAFLTALADAIEYIHKAGYLHRDLCPRNVMVNNQGVLKVIDFSLSIPNRPEYCKPGNRTGSTDYLAPEVVKRVATDHRVDLFMLGVTAYEVITGVLPWEKGTSEETLLRHLNQPGRNPRDVKPDIDEATAAFLTKAIERSPAERFQTAADFRDALKGLPKQ
jgi:eukaryotic-like serine/threonine-protein kinase